MLRLPAIALVAATLCLAAPALHAQAPGSTTSFQLEQWEPSPLMGTDILSVSTSDVTPHLRPSFGILVHYVDDPLVVRRVRAQEVIKSRLVDDQLKLELAVALGLFDHLAVGFVLPMMLAQSGDDLTLAGRPGEQVRGFGLQDARLFIKARIMRPEDFGGFGLHVTVPIYLPLGDSDSFGSDETYRVRPTLGLEYRTDSGFIVAGNIGYMIRPTRASHNYVSDDGFTFALGLEVPTPVADLSLLGSLFGAIQSATDREPFALERGEVISDAKVGAEVPLEVLGALRYRLDSDWSVEAGGGVGLAKSVGTPTYRLFGGLAFSPNDRGLERTCPGGGREDEDGYRDDDSCPDPDNDGDGVLDLVDGARDARGFGACRNNPEDVDGFQDEDGCPDPDNDGDGVEDTADACPNHPEDKDGFEDANGCPDPDNDRDGVPDVADGPVDATGFGACRDNPEDKDSFEDGDGCPEPDNDHDGVADADDPTPDGPVAGNTPPNGPLPGANGEPVVVSENVRIAGGKLVILKKVFFAYDKDIIKPESYGILDEVAKVLVDNPWISKIRVDGHTDSDGPDKYNLDLSSRRVKSVARYLAGKGVPAARLTSKGFGESLPLEPNATPVGRAANRRVEFTILEVNGKPVTPDSGVETEDNRPKTIE